MHKLNDKSVALAKYRYKKKKQASGPGHVAIFLNLVFEKFPAVPVSFELVCEIFKLPVFNFHKNLTKEVCIKARSPSASLRSITLK